MLFNPKLLIFFLILNENMCVKYALEAPRRGASNENLQHGYIFMEK